MTAVKDVLTPVLLVLAVAAAALSVAGVFAMEDGPSKAHFLAPVSVIGGVCLAAAVVLHDALNTRGLKALVVLVILAALNPLLGHAVVRLARSQARQPPKP